jgi:superfamily II DNA/RNA helicase
MDLFNYLANKTKGAISLEDVRMVVLDEVDQLIARNLADYVSTLLRILPQPRLVQASNATDPRSPSLSPGLPPSSSANMSRPFSPFESSQSGQEAAAASSENVQIGTTDRQTAIFSNTVPQDVLNFAQSIHLRESVRVLVRREGAAGQGLPSAPVGTTAGPMGTFHSNSSASALSLGASASQYPHAQQQQQQMSINALGASPGKGNQNQALPDAVLSSLRGLRQYYLYVAVSTGGNSIGGLQSPNPNASQISHAIEMKLDVITDLLEDIDFGQAVIYTSSMATQEAVTYKLASKGIEALALHKEMASTTRQQVLAKYRSSSGTPNHSSSQYNLHHSAVTKRALVVYDVVVNPKDVHQVPLIVFYDLPRSVEEYKEKISCAVSGGMGRPSVCVNVVTGSGGPRGDIEMLRTLECHLGCKMAELPMNPSQILNF